MLLNTSWLLGISRIKTCLTVWQWSWWKAPTWPGGRTQLWKIFLISGKIEKFETKRLLKWDQFQLRGARYRVCSGPALGSQSSLLGDSLGPVVWAPALLSKHSGKPWGRFRRRQSLIWDSCPCHGPRSVLRIVLSCVKLYCHKAQVQMLTGNQQVTAALWPATFFF